MILNESHEKSFEIALNERKALPSKQLISALGSVSNGFIFSATPIIMRVLKEICKGYDDSARSFIASGWLYASIVGILLFGYIGDTLGYYRGMLIATALSCVGSLLGAVALYMTSDVLLYVYGVSRIITGVGCGGSIPIAYTRTHTEKSTSSSMNASLLIIQGCSWLFGPVFFFLVLSCSEKYGFSLQRSLQFALYVSCIPSIISFMILLRSKRTVVYTPLVEHDLEENEASSIFKFDLLRAFLATGVTWFFYDFISYGNTFNSKQVLSTLYEVGDTPLASTIPLILAGLFGVPGQFLVKVLLRWINVKTIQYLGFMVLFLLFCLIAWILQAHPSSSYSTSFVCIALYHLTFFFSTCGPGSTTYILPTLVYPSESLSFYHGLCSCMGKLGGALGATYYPYIIQRWGVPVVGEGVDIYSRLC